MIDQNFGLIFFFAYHLSTSFRNPAFAKIVLEPENIVVKVGDPTILRCFVQPADDCILWIHNHPKVNDHDNQGDREVYDCYSGVNANFLKRFYVDRNTNTGKSNLNIKNSEIEDAGTYECQDQSGYGEKRSAKLFVIDDDPKCESSVPLQEVVGPNDCGITPDEISLSCTVTFKGPKGSQPKLEWRRVSDNKTLNQTCDVVGDRLSCTAKLNATLDLNGTSYICTTTQSSTSQYNCTTETIRLLQAYNTRFEQHVPLKEELFCEAKLNCECTYIWKSFEGKNDVCTISDDCSFTPEQFGSYRCEANCTIRNSSCHIIPRIVHALPMQSHSTSEDKTKFAANSLCALLISLGLLYSVE